MRVRVIPSVYMLKKREGNFGMWLKRLACGKHQSNRPPGRPNAHTHARQESGNELAFSTSFFFFFRHSEIFISPEHVNRSRLIHGRGRANGIVNFRLCTDECDPAVFYKGTSTGIGPIWMENGSSTLGANLSLPDTTCMG